MKLLDKAYEELINSSNKKGLPFQKILEISLPNNDGDAKQINNLYTGIEMDYRFIKVQNDLWSLRKFYTLKEIEELVTDNISTEDFDDNDVSLEKNEINQK